MEQQEIMRKPIQNKIKNILMIIFLIIVITILHYSKSLGLSDFHDFYRRLYYIPIVFGAFKFRLRGGFIISTIIVILYAPHRLVYFQRINLEIINQFLESGMFMFMGLITGYLVEQEYKREKKLEFQLIKMANLENYTHNILESIDCGVIAIESNGSTMIANRQVKKILGDKENVDMFLHKTGMFKYVEKILSKEKQVVKKEVNYINNHNEKLYIRLKFYPIENTSNTLEGAVIVLKDITMIKQLENQVKLGEKLAAIGELASGVAHEIRNPLAIIKTISQTLYKDCNDNELKECLTIIHHEIDRANKVIKEILDFAKPVKSKYSLLNLEIIINDIMIITRRYAKHENINLVLKVLINSHIYGDADRLKQGFINIILNSIHSMKNGGEIKIILTEEDENYLRISFIDKGEGISQEKLEKIFEPFFTTKENGTGLGLSITHRVIEEHRGRIDIQSELGKGTDVNIYLPRAKGGIVSV